MHTFKRPLRAASVTELSYTMKSLVVFLGLLVAAVQAAPGERFSDGPTPLNVYMPLIEGAPKVQAPKIVNGYPATPGQFPHQAAILINSSVFCGGSLLSPIWVLTAAHCAQGNLFEVILGRLIWNGPGGVSVMASYTIVHSDYNPSTLTNDIALLRLPLAGAYAKNIRPVELPPQDFDTYEGAHALVSGYGSTSETGFVSPILNFVDLDIIGNSLCAEYYGADIVPPGVICASGAGGKSPCNGDSGGPLVVLKGDVYRQIGIVSFVSVVGCASGYPSGYTRVSFYLDWICINARLCPSS